MSCKSWFRASLVPLVAVPAAASGTLLDNAVLIKSFGDASGSTPISAENDGTYIWTAAGGSPNYPLARYSQAGTLDVVFTPGPDFRSIYTNNAGGLFAKDFGVGDIWSITQAGTGVILYTLNDIESQSAASLNGDDSELYTMSGGQIRRYDAANGASLGSFALSGWGTVGSESIFPDDVQMETTHTGRILTYTQGIVSEWDLAGNRVGMCNVGNPTPGGFETTWSFGVDGNGRVYLFDEGNASWEVYDVGAGAGGGCDLYAANGNGSPVNPGGLATLDAGTFAGTLLSTPLGSGGFSGLTFTPDDRLWASVRYGFGVPTDLAELDPVSGALISLTPITDGLPETVRISDLATHPGSGVVYAIGSSDTHPFGTLYTINTATALATLVGTAGLGSDGGIAFAPDGTLYLISAAVANPFLATLDPATAAPITVIGYGPDVGCDGIAVRPSDGALLGTRGQFAGGDLIVSVNPVSGATAQLGSTGTGTPSDLAFRPCGDPGPGTATCFGDGSGTACPCGNPGGPGAGCANGTGAGGVLSASGTASVSSDSMSLTADGVINNNGLFFQGNNTIGGGAGVVFGDGLRCCGGNVVRIEIVNPPGTTSPATAQMTETATTNGPNGTIVAGGKKCYQYWYRDPSTSPCGTQFNLTNAVTVTWQP